MPPSLRPRPRTPARWRTRTTREVLLGDPAAARAHELTVMVHLPRVRPVHTDGAWQIGEPSVLCGPDPVVPVFRCPQRLVEPAGRRDQPRAQERAHRGEPVAVEQVLLHRCQRGADGLQPDGGQVTVGDVVVREDEITSGKPIQEGHLPLQFVRQQDVVGIQEADRLTGRSGETRIASRAETAVRFGHDRDPAVAGPELVGDRLRGISRAIVHDDQLEVPPSLVQDALDRVREEPLRVVGGDDHRDASGGRGAHRLPYRPSTA